MFDTLRRLFFRSKTRGLEIERRLAEPADSNCPTVSAYTYARIKAIQARTLSAQAESERRLRRLRETDATESIPVMFYNPYLRDAAYESGHHTSRPELDRFTPGGGESGGAGASATWDPPVSDTCSPSVDSSPSCGNE